MKVLGCDDFELAVHELDRGKLVVYPTDTVYGIGCRLLEDSVKRVFRVKKRSDKPLSIAVSSVDVLSDFAELCFVDLVEDLLPGPFTFIFRKLDSVPDFVTAGLPTVGVRVPKHPVAQRLAEGGPIITTSANLSGEPPASSFEEVNVEVDLGIDCGSTLYGMPSTIIDLSSGEPEVVRRGAEWDLVRKRLKSLG